MWPVASSKLSLADLSNYSEICLNCYLCFEKDLHKSPAGHKGQKPWIDVSVLRLQQCILTTIRLHISCFFGLEKMCAIEITAVEKRWFRVLVILAIVASLPSGPRADGTGGGGGGSVSCLGRAKQDHFFLHFKPWRPATLAWPTSILGSHI